MADETAIDYRALLARYTAYENHRSVILDALRIAVASGGYEYERKRYEDALEALATGGDRPKLVRDKIPDLIRSRGLEPVTRTASDGEMPALLRDKLAEETAEYVAGSDPAELADVIEVVYALAVLHGLDAAGLEGLRAAKAAERGTFAGRTVWAGNREPGSEEEPS